MSLAPQLQKITVDPNKLLLDPNNPRLFSKQEERVPLENYPDPGVQDHTKKRIETANDDFKIGAPEFWNHHSNNCKDDFDDDEEEFTFSKRKGPMINVKKTFQ